MLWKDTFLSEFYGAAASARRGEYYDFADPSDKGLRFKPVNKSSGKLSMKDLPSAAVPPRSACGWLVENSGMTGESDPR